MNTTPVSLLERLREGASADSWNQFVELYTPLMSVWVRKLGVADQDREDVLQDVFVTLVRHLPDFQYDPTRRFRGWLWTIVANRVRSRQQKEQSLPHEQSVIDVPERFNDQTNDPDEREYLTHLLRGAMRLLRRDFEESTWIAFESLALHGRSAATVADELGMTTGAVHAARFRVVSRLRQVLSVMID